jgi:hypothetical protein
MSRISKKLRKEIRPALPNVQNTEHRPEAYTPPRCSVFLCQEVL